MAFRDWMNRMRGSVSRVAADFTRRPDGGTSCYRPLRKRAAEPVPGPQGPETNGADQPIAYAHTGFTGMNPPAETGWMPPVSGAGRQNPSWNGQAAYNGNPAGFRQADVSARQPAARPDNGWFPPREENPRDNISYMPGVRPGGPDGVHVEHIIALTGLRSCYEAIECMKNGETLIVTLDAIANDSESMRCQDMLAGAAFTLGCTVRLLQGHQVVLIAPEGVKILPEQAAPQAVPMPQEILNRQPEGHGTAFSGRRERRSGNRNADWIAAQNGELNGYNPYTGTVPVAAGAYSSFGGYGY